MDKYPVYRCYPQEFSRYNSNKYNEYNEYNSIICVSGDGLMAEALNGIMLREDWSKIIQNLILSPLPGN